MTLLTAPGGLRADGDDIALIDVEAIDANGERCPTFQQRADFETTGPAIWRGGYNSGKINSTNNTFLDLEAGINRVAVRATRTAGTITVRAKSAGLRDASVKIESHAFAGEMPVAPTVALAASAPTHPAFNAPGALIKSAGASGAATMAGKFIKTLNYTGPESAIVHVEINAANGRNIYIDRDYIFSDLPATLAGADWVQTADADQRYSAVDLIELAVKGGTTVTIAHDERAPLPAWLTKQFETTNQVLTINGKPMKLFTHAAAKDESLTFGSNTDGAPVRANQYVVLVNAAK
jgi:beta-galactosidase